MFNKDEMEMNQEALESIESGENVGIGAKEDIDMLISGAVFSEEEEEQENQEELAELAEPEILQEFDDESDTEPKEKYFSAQKAEIPQGGEHLFVALGWNEDDDEIEIPPQSVVLPEKKKPLTPRQRRELKEEEKAKKLLEKEARRKQEKREKLEAKAEKKEKQQEKKAQRAEKKKLKKAMKNGKKASMNLSGKEIQPKTDPKICILMRTYNPHRKALKAQLVSINKQNYTNLKLIILDDCSTAISKNDLEGFIKDNITEIPFELYQNDEHIGISKSYEKLTEMSSGEYIAYASQDDIWHPGKIKRCLVEMERKPSTMIFSDASIIDENGKVLRQSVANRSFLNAYKSGYGLAGFILRKNFIVPETTFVKTDVAKEALPFCEEIPYMNYLGFYCGLRGRMTFVGRPLIRKRLYTQLPPGRTDEIIADTKEKYVKLNITQPIEAMKWITNENILIKAKENYFIEREEKLKLEAQERERMKMADSGEEDPTKELLDSVETLLAEANEIQASLPKEPESGESDTDTDERDKEPKEAEEQRDASEENQKSADTEVLVVMEKNMKLHLEPDWNEFYSDFEDEIKRSMLWMLTRRKIFGSRKGILRGMWTGREFGIGVTIWELFLSFLPECLFRKMMERK